MSETVSPSGIVVWPKHLIRLSQLRNFEKNPRQINRASLERLKGSIKRYGVTEGPVVNLIEGSLDAPEWAVFEIVAGHQRARALSELGVEEAWCTVTQYDPLTEAGANIAHNGEFGEWDQPKLRSLVAELRAEDYDTDALFLPNYQLESILQSPDYQIGAALGEGDLAATPSSVPPSGATSDDTVEDTDGADTDDPAAKTLSHDNKSALDALPEQWLVIVTCSGEAEQVALLERLIAEGRSCRALVS